MGSGTVNLATEVCMQCVVESRLFLPTSMTLPDSTIVVMLHSCSIEIEITHSQYYGGRYLRTTDVGVHVL